MISDFLTNLERGIKAMRSNSRMLLVGILVFVFPILFVWITQNFFNTAYDNINSSEKKRISILHDSVVSAINYTDTDTDALSTLLSSYTSSNPDITKIRIVDEVAGAFQILISTDLSKMGSVEKSDDLYRTLPLGNEQSLIVESSIDGQRVWQSFRKVTVDNNELFIFSEHSFAVIDSIMAQRKQQSYYGLTAIFLFLIVLAYWLNRQVYWHKERNVLQEQLIERDMFSNMIAHEFRTPLTAIKGYASFLEESKAIPLQERRYATNIHLSAERLVILVSDFLEVARLQSGKMQMNVQPVNICNVLNRVVEDLTALAAEKDISLEFVQPKEQIILDTDADRMVQILTNIITNSIKYTESGKVVIICEETRGKVTLRIKDTGMGISAEDQQKLFTPFTRVGGVDQTTTTGSGLGMWITSQIVSLLHGTIGVESIKGVGTHVVITFAKK